MFSGWETNPVHTGSASSLSDYNAAPVAAKLGDTEGG